MPSSEPDSLLQISDQSAVMEPAVRSSSPPSSPLSVLSKSPSLSPLPLDLDASMRYPSPSSTSMASGSASPIKLPDMTEEICVRTDGPPPPKRRKVSTPKKQRTTEYIDLDTRSAEDEAHLDRLLLALRKKKKIVVIAGAGISVSAGIPDFRSATGLFSTLRGQHKIKASGKHLFDASVYKHDSSTKSFHTMVRELAQMTSQAKPTAFHHLLASLAQEGRLLRLYSQNVDCIDTQMPPLATKVPLDPKGPWPTTIQLHGGLEKMVCSMCGHLATFEPALFNGAEPPPCNECAAADEVRINFAGKRSRGVGRLRPRIVLYNEYNPDEDAIGAVCKADLRRVPDAVVVVGTSLKIPGVRRLVKEMCQVTRGRRDGLTAWLNIDPEPQGADFKDCWDFVVRGHCDDVAQLVALPRWDEQDIGEREAYMVTGDEARERTFEAGRCRDRIDILLESKRLPLDKTDVATADGAEPATPSAGTEAKSKRVEQVLGGMPTPSASPRLHSPLPAKDIAKTKQSKLSFGGQATATGRQTAPPPTKTKKSRKSRQSKDIQPKGKHGLMQTFKTTKNLLDLGKKGIASDMDTEDTLTDRSPSPSSSLPSSRPPSRQHVRAYNPDADLPDWSDPVARSLPSLRPASKAGLATIELLPAAKAWAVSQPQTSIEQPTASLELVIPDRLDHQQ